MAGYAKYRTLKEMRHELQARLGFGAAGTAANVNQLLLDSMLRQAHADLYEMADWPELKAYSDLSTPSNGSRLTYPANCNINRITKVSVNVGSVGTPNWQKMSEGLDDQHWSAMGNAGRPSRYERFADGLEIFPYRDQTYTLRLFYVQDATAFTDDSDRPSVRDEVVFLYALSMAKAHYKQQDAGTYAQQLEAVLAPVKRAAWGNRRFLSKADAREFDQVETRPVVV